MLLHSCVRDYQLQKLLNIRVSWMFGEPRPLTLEEPGALEEPALVLRPWLKSLLGPFWPLFKGYMKTVCKFYIQLMYECHPSLPGQVHVASP